MNSKLEAILRVTGDLECFEKDVVSASNQETEHELDVSALEQVSAAAKHPYCPNEPQKKD
jgi:hypothetical protein